MCDDEIPLDCVYTDHDGSIRKVQCPTCGKDFITNNNRKRYCHSGCRMNKPILERKCKACGKSFETRNSRKVNCDDNGCKRKRQANRGSGRGGKK